MNRKKTLYEILEISPNAPLEEIQAAHQRLSQKLQSLESQLDREDFEFKQKLANLALATLSDPGARAEYDESIAAQGAPASAAAHRNALALRADPETITRRAEAMALRADALALRADALSIRTDASPLRVGDGEPSMLARVLESLKSPFKRVVVAIGTLAATAMIIQVAFLFFAVRKSEQISADAARAEEQMILQEYYQKHGVRPKTAAEAKLLEEEHRRSERELRLAENEKQRAEEENRRFHESFKRTAEQVSADLRYAEENARREEELRKVRLEEERRAREAEERERAQQEQEKWRNVLAR